MAKGFTEEDDALLAELGVEIETKKVAARTPREERIIAGFEEIQRFVDQNGRVPSHRDDRDIFERIYATRLDRLRELGEASDLLLGLDHQGLLSAGETASETDLEQLDDDALLAELGIKADVPTISELKHVRSAAEKKKLQKKSRAARSAMILIVTNRSLNRSRRSWILALEKRANSKSKQRSNQGVFLSSVAKRLTLRRWERSKSPTMVGLMRACALFSTTVLRARC